VNTTAYDKARTHVALYHPFAAKILSRTEIELTDSEHICSIDKDRKVTINPEMFESISLAMAEFTLVHAVHQLVLIDPKPYKFHMED